MRDGNCQRPSRRGSHLQLEQFLRESQSSPQPLINNAGWSSGATAAWNASGITWATFGGNQTDQNGQLLNTYLGNSGGTESVTISGIPFSSYDVYVYFTTAGSTSTGRVSLSGKFDHYLTLGPITTLPYPLIQTTDSTYDSTGNSYPATNYALFSNLSGSSQTISLSTQSFADSGFAAVDIRGTVILPGTAFGRQRRAAHGQFDRQCFRHDRLARWVNTFVVAGNNTLFVTGSGTAANTAYSLTLGSGSLAGQPHVRRGRQRRQRGNVGVVR